MEAGHWLPKRSGFPDSVGQTRSVDAIAKIADPARPGPREPTRIPERGQEPGSSRALVSGNGLIRNPMTSSEVAFSRAIIASVVAFCVLAVAYFRLYGQRARVAVARHLGILLPCVGAASVGASIAFELPLVAKVLC
jgi:hypothetical protein